MSFKSEFLNNVYESVVKRDPNQKEFIQAVKEVLESLEPVIERKPEIAEIKGLIDLRSLEVNDKLLEKHEYNSEKEKRIKHFFLKVAKIDMSNLNFDVSKLNILIKYLDYDLTHLLDI